MKPSLKHFFQPPLMRLWLAFWLIIFSTIFILGLIAPDYLILTLVKLSGIFLCIVYALYRSPKDHLLQLALFVTFVADIFLAVSNTSPYGLLVFFTAQIIHFIRLSPPTKKHQPLLLFIFIAFAVTTLVAFCAPDYTTPTIAGFYLIMLLANLYLAQKWQQSTPNNLPAHAAFFGFLLFLCCDLCTGLSFFSLTGALPLSFYRPANFFAWFFYYPSQILVSNSSKCATMNLKKEIVL